MGAGDGSLDSSLTWIFADSGAFSPCTLAFPLGWFTVLREGGRGRGFERLDDANNSVNVGNAFRVGVVGTGNPFALPSPLALTGVDGPATGSSAGKEVDTSIGTFVPIGVIGRAAGSPSSKAADAMWRLASLLLAWVDGLTCSSTIVVVSRGGLDNGGGVPDLVSGVTRGLFLEGAS